MGCLWVTCRARRRLQTPRASAAGWASARRARRRSQTRCRPARPAAGPPPASAPGCCYCVEIKSTCENAGQVMSSFEQCCPQILLITSWSLKEPCTPLLFHCRTLSFQQKNRAQHLVQVLQLLVDRAEGELRGPPAAGALGPLQRYRAPAAPHPHHRRAAQVRDWPQPCSMATQLCICARQLLDDTLLAPCSCVPASLLFV